MRPGGELEKSSGAGSVLGWHELVCLVPASRLSRGLGTRSLKARQKRGTPGRGLGLQDMAKAQACE